MNKRWLVLFVMFSFCSVSKVVAQEDDKELREQIDKIITFDTDIEYDLTPGFLVGIIDRGNTYILPFGHVVGDRSKKLLQDDIFEVGSISKSFTTSLLDVLVAENKLQLTDSVNSFLPQEFQNPRMKGLTIQNLINHTSGLPKRPSKFGERELEMQNPYKYYSKADLLNFFAHYVPPKTTEFLYSHTNYGLLEIVIEQVTGLSYDVALRKYLLDDLGMATTFVHFGEARENVLTPGVDRSGTKVQPWEFASFSASEGVKSTMDDLLLFLRANMGTSNTKFDKIFGDNFVNYMPSFNDDLAVSNGWHVYEANKKMKAIVNSGTTSGYGAFIGMVRETQTGVVVLSNSAYGTKDLALLILRMVNKNWKRKA